MATSDYARIERAILYLDAHAQEQPRLAEVAAHVGLSPYHFQRLFTRWAGISPKRFLQFQTLEHAKQLLAERRSTLDVTYDAGLSSGGRLHDLFVTLTAMTPGEFKQGGAGLTIPYSVHASPFGDHLLAVCERGICALRFLMGTSPSEAVRELRAEWPHATLVEAPEATRPYAERIFPARKSRTLQSLSLFVKGTNFQLKVWEALLRIPPGAVATYEDIARSLQMPRATRAVGSAVGDNPIALLIPCHRVIRKTGAFGEYRWGLARKRAMLTWESARYPSGEAA
ncbi:methylated-DNA--[protein]-cysteine S-methyltransferase [Hyalangium sp.]|uniref:bifunctional transcriptional activator/DNA repair enzyme AdaA n=1 Tax=Hyalangium sp. TaxID=2028555 RepID=UPI002D751C25|nr:methylated-DNA--[protein]-cysteine S-methyltransferase [Hyalangium sp.]HYH98669.1 methylated-DNA--[protein]-cysteine S-methyltransferase [Hyalangium sp.]